MYSAAIRPSGFVYLRLPAGTLVRNRHLHEITSRDAKHVNPICSHFVVDNVRSEKKAVKQPEKPFALECFDSGHLAPGF